jgi:hypothetical protein
MSTPDAPQTLHAWLGRYEAGGLEAVADRSHRPVSCPRQMPAAVEAALDLRRVHRAWGAAADRGGTDPPRRAAGSRLGAVHRALTRAGLAACCGGSDPTPLTGRSPPGRRASVASEVCC